MERELEPPVLVGEKVFWLGNFQNKPVCGTVKWIGNIPEINSGWCVGIELDTPLPHLECNGFWKNRKLFECRSKHGLIAPLNEIQKINSKNKFVSTENNLRLHLDDTQTGVFAHPYLRKKFIEKETHRKNHRSNLEESSIHESFKNRTPKPEEVKKVEQRKTTKLLSDSLQDQKSSRRKSEDIRALLKNEKTPKKNLEKTERNSENDLRLLNSFPDFNENLKDVQRLDLKTFIREPVINMNEVAGYFKEIKEGDERTETQNKMDDLALYGMVDATEPGQSKPKKLFSFLKWFNKKQKHDPNLKLFKETSAASSPIFPRKETSSCESIDTIFSTQTVRSFAYIPPTQYVPSAPPLEYDKSSYENLCENDSSQKSKSEETESIYERRKKRRAPEPPRLSRENSLPTTLERKTNEDEDFDGIKTYHRRTVSESFKDKKAGAYCHVQGKRKAPLPPGSALYPNLQKLDNQYPSLYKKKKPAPPPPELNLRNRNSGEAHQSRKDGQNGDEKNSPNEKIQKEKLKDSKDNRIPGKEEKGVKISQSSKVSLTKDSSLSPLPSRPWYKRNHRDSTGSNIIRKDLLKGFDKKKKESDDWMPEVGFSRRSLSSESGHNKFNIFSKLEKTEDKKKEEKRKSQISILTNISELDREAAEIVRKEQAEEKKMMAANDDKYYSSKEKEKDLNFSQPLRNDKTHCNVNNKNILVKHKEVNDEQEGKRNVQSNDKILQTRISTDEINTKEVKDDKNHKVKDEQPNAREDKIKGRENHSVADKKSKENVKQKPPSTTTLAGLINPSTQALVKEKEDNSSQTPSQSRLNHFNVENKKLSYLNEPWVCKKCTLENPGWRVFCEICNSVKPRFLFNQAASNVDASKEKHHQNNSQKPEMVTEKPNVLKESNLEEKNQNQATKAVVGTTSRPQEAEDEKENTKSEVILDDLRKKRMTFFTSKLETLPETNKNDTALNNTSDEMNLLPKDKQEKEKLTKSGAENFINTDMKNPKKEKIKWPESPEEPTVPQEKPKTIAVPTEQTANDDLNSGTIENPTTSGNSQVIEAYVVTKTVVLEDIIVKKPERGRKVSAKSKRSTSPEAKVISPPPRAKKIVFDVTPEAKAETETPSNSGNGFQKIAENHRQEEIEKLTSRLTQAEGLADFRANIETMAPNTEMNTVAVNRLLRKLETAINCGDHFLAGSLAKELALMKINCSVTRQVTPTPSTSNVILDLYIEDKVSHQGPIPIEVSPSISVLQLKNKVKQELGIPLEVQRWILGKKLATDDSKTLEAEGVKSNYSPVFLYLVAPDNRKTNKSASTKSEKSTSSEKPHQNSDESPPGAKRKGLYYNYEEDRESYCEDSEEEKKASSPDCTDKTKGISPPAENKFFNNDKKSAAAEIGIGMKENPPSVFDLKSRDTENDLEKELKLISVNSVKQKVEKINKSFVENAKAVKPLFRHSRSPETWKCGACHFVNSPGKLNCSSCNVKKVFSGPYSRKPEDGNQLIKEGLPKKENQNPTNGANIHYKALIELQDADLVPNTDPFNCSICLMDYTSGEGVTLKDCLHTFCRTCLISTVQFSEDAEVKCPYLDETYSCPSVLQQREIKALVPRGIFELHLAKSVKEAENKINNAFHCKTPDCKGWCIYEDNVNEFHCPVCKSTNCLTCQAVHNGINCREFQERMKVASETDVDAKKTTDMLNEMVEKGEAMACPKCQVVLMKKWGCDWLKCSMCKTEICWVTRGFRWGPEGKGDTSGGCKCGVNGIKCHPKCNYCH